MTLIHQKILMISIFLLTLCMAILPAVANTDEQALQHFGENRPTNLQWSPNGDFLAVQADTDVLIYDAELQPIYQHRGGVDALRWLPSQPPALALYHQESDTTTLLNPQTRELTVADWLPSRFGSRLGAFSEDGQHYVQFLGSPLEPHQNSLHLWDITTGSFIREEALAIPLDDRVDGQGAIRWDEDGIIAIISTQNHRAWLFTAQAEPPQRLSWEDQQGAAGQFMLSDDGNYAVNRVGQSLLVWDLQDVSSAHVITLPEVVASYDVQNGHVVAVDRQGNAGVWRLDDLAQVWEHHTAPDVNLKVQWQPQTNHVSVVSANGVITLWDIFNDEKITSTYNHALTECVYWSADGLQLLTTYQDMSVVFDAQTGFALRGVQGDYFVDTPLTYRPSGGAIAWTADGQYMAVVHQDGAVSIHGYGDEHPLYTLPTVADIAAWSANGDYLATWRDGHTLTLWTAGGEALGSLQADSPILGFAWSQNSSQLMLATSQNITLYDVLEADYLQTFRLETPVNDGQASVNWRGSSALISFNLQAVTVDVTNGTIVTLPYPVGRAVLSADGRYASVNTADVYLPSGIIDTQTGDYVLELPTLWDITCRSAWHPTESRLAISVEFGRNGIWSP